MTREEAYNRIDAIIAKYEIDDEYVTITNFKDYDALRIAREILEQKPITIYEIPKDYKYDTETEDFLVYRHKYTGDEIHIERPVPLYRLKQEPILDKIKAEIEQLRNLRAEHYDLEVYTKEYNLRKDAEMKVYKLEKAIGEIKERIEEMIDKNTTFDSDNSRAQIIALEWVSEVIDEKVKEYTSCQR